MAYRGGGKPGNKNAEKWTEEKALELGNNLLKWMTESNTNLAVETFLYEINNYPVGIVERLKEKYKSFAKLFEQALKVQKGKLMTGSILNKYNAGFVKFLLINNHGMQSDKNITNINMLQQQETNTTQVLNLNFNKEEALKIDEILFSTRNRTNLPTESQGKLGIMDIRTPTN